MPSLPPFPRSLGTSALEAMATCPRRWWWEHLRGLAPAEPSPHLAVGAAVAAALEAWRCARLLGRRAPEAAAAGMWALLRSWPPSAAEDAGKPFWLAAAALAAYWERWADERTRAAEMTFALPLPGTEHPEGGPVLFESRFDAIIEMAGRLWVLDDKTASALGASWPRQWPLRGQLIGYVWAARELGYPVSGFIVRGLRIKGREPELAETAPVPVGDWLIEEWLSATRERVAEAVRLWRTAREPLGVFGPQCTIYGGCPWREVCLTPPKGRETALASLPQAEPQQRRI